MVLYFIPLCLTVYCVVYANCKMVAGKNHGNVYLCLCNTFHDDSLNVLKEKKMGAIYKSITNGTTMQSM